MHFVEEILLNDCKVAIARSAAQFAIAHKGLRGTIREDILSSILRPWLPSYVSLGKGTIIDSQNADSFEGEDDIILCDEQLCPPLKFDSNTKSGIYHFNGVLGRIEVKSKLEKKDIRRFMKRSRSITQFRIDVRQVPVEPIYGAYNLLLAYDSAAKKKDELVRLLEVCNEEGIDPCSGIVTAYCVLGKGIYKFGNNGQRIWVKSKEATPAEQMGRFVAIVGEMTLRAHVVRQGRKINDSLEISLGSLLKNPFWEKVSEHVAQQDRGKSPTSG